MSSSARIVGLPGQDAGLDLQPRVFDPHEVRFMLLRVRAEAELFEGCDGEC